MISVFLHALTSKRIPIYLLFYTYFILAILIRNSHLRLFLLLIIILGLHLVSRCIFNFFFTCFFRFRDKRSELRFFLDICLTRLYSRYLWIQLYSNALLLNNNSNFTDVYSNNISLNYFSYTNLYNLQNQKKYLEMC